MNYAKKILIIMIAVLTVFLYCNYSHAALYQFDDVAGMSGIGAQWVGFMNYSPILAPYPIVGHHSAGGPTTLRMNARADLISNNNSIYLQGDVYPLHTLYLVVPEGIGTLSSNFEYTGSLGAVTQGVYGGNFESSYPSIINYPTPGSGASVNVDIIIEKRTGERNVYDSNLGELIFHQNPTTVPSQTLHIPFVIANVHDGSAQHAPLEIKSTTRNISGDIVGRRWLKWDVLSDKSAPADPVDWIFVPIEDSVIDKNEFIYNFTTEVTNHTGLRYGIQRYDDNRTLMPSHWKFDLQPISDRLPKILHLNPLSHIVPGLVTIYSHDAKVTVGQQKLLRLAAVDTTGAIIGSKLLELRYRTVYGYELSSVQDTREWTSRNSFWELNAFLIYQSNRNFFAGALRTMGITNENFFFPTRSADILTGNVSNTFPPITADALSSFTLSAPVPLMTASILSKDANGNESWVTTEVFPKASAMLGVNVVLRIPKTNRFIAEHWDSFAASRNLANDFGRYFSIWFRSPENYDLNVSQYLMDESKYDRTVKVFIDEENECITVNYLVLLIEEGNSGNRKRPKIRIVSDASTVNDYDYIAVNDGVDNGKWEMIFYVAPTEATPLYPPYPTNPVKILPGANGESGCSAFSIPFLILVVLLIPIKRAIKIFSISVILVFAFCPATFAAAPMPELVIYESDALTSGTLRNSINRINNGLNESNIILFDNLNRINITAPLSIDVDMDIDGNGTSISGNGTFRLFNVKRGARVYFRNMTFMNGSDEPQDSNGGAVHVGDGAQVYFDKCTFTQNVASGDGGAVYSDGESYFTNCTFYNNSGSNGGAVYGAPSSTLSFSFVTMSSNKCSAPNGGNAVNAKGMNNVFQASIFTGNGSGGDEIVCSLISRSLGYNVFGDSSFQGTDHETDLYDKTAIDIFGVTPVFHRNDAAPGWRNWPYTLALASRSGNPAMSIIPISYLNSAGVLVDQRFIVRTNGNHPASAGSYEVYNPEAPVTSLEIGGIPNGISTIGFTAQLRAYTLPEYANPGVMWRSDNSSVVAVTLGGRVYSVGSGVTLLWATTSGYDTIGKQISKALLVKVGKDQEKYSNIPPELANMLLTLNNSVLAPEGVQFYLQSARNDFSDPESFRQEYGNYPSIIDPLPVNSTITSNRLIYGMSENYALKPSVKFSAPVGRALEISIVPFLLSISLSAKEISDVIGNSDFSVEKFFEIASFCTGANAEIVLIDNGAKGISASEAENRGVLSVQEDSGNVTFILSGWFAATEKSNSVVDGQLVLSDGGSNETIESEIWLTASAVNNTFTTKETTKGCNSWHVGGIALLIIMSIIFGVKKRMCKVLLFPIVFFPFFLFAGAAFGEPITANLNYSILQIVRNQPVFYITVTAQPAATSYTYIWSTTDLSVVSLTSAATSTVGINGAGKGKAVVVCEVISNDGVTKAYASCDVTVFETGMSGASIEPSPASLYLGFKEWLHLVPDHQPVGAEPINSIWATDDVSIVSVDHDGNILAKSKGTATITYTAVAIPIGGGDPRSFDAKCKVTVLKPVLSIDISQNPSPVMVGRRGNVSAVYFPEDADSVDIAWSAIPFDASVVSIEPTSSLAMVFNAIGFPAPNRTQGINPVTVTASSVHWKNISFVPDVSCEIVIDPVQVSDVSVTPSAPSVISRDDRVQLSQTVAPANATKSTDYWASSNPLVASVSDSGLVIGVNQGQSEIKYTFVGFVINDDGTHSLISKSASSFVIVASPPSRVRVSDIEIEPTKLKLPKGTSFQIMAWVTPYYATNKTIHWSSGNYLIATVDSFGLVTARNPGTVYIYADPADKGIDDNVGPVTCEITVYDDAVVVDPAFVDISSALQNKIEQMNSSLKLKGLEVNFGFPHNKPNSEVLMLYGQSPVIIPKIDEASKLEIKSAKPISADNLESVMSSAEFEVDVSIYSLLGHTPILPVSLKMMIAKDILSEYLPDYSIEELLKNPRQYLTPIFNAFSFHKHVIDVAGKSYLVPLFNSPAVALEAERLGIIVLRGVGDQLEITLNYYVADSGMTDANILDGCLIVGDGSANGIIRDPIWICVPKTAKEEESDTDDTDDTGVTIVKREKSSGCDLHPGLNIVKLIVIIMSYLVIFRKIR